MKLASVGTLQRLDWHSHFVEVPISNSNKCDFSLYPLKTSINCEVANTEICKLRRGCWANAMFCGDTAYVFPLGPYVIQFCSYCAG